MDETDQQRDARLWGEVRDAAATIAMHEVAGRLGEDQQPLADALYERLEDLGPSSLARIVVLLLHETGSAQKLAEQMLTVDDTPGRLVELADGGAA